MKQEDDQIVMFGMPSKEEFEKRSPRAKHAKTEPEEAADEASNKAEQEEASNKSTDRTLVENASETPAKTVGKKPHKAFGKNSSKAANKTSDKADNKKKKCVIGIGIIVLLIAAALAGWFVLSQDSWKDPNAQIGYFPGKSEEEIQAALNAKVQEGMVNVSIASTINFENGSKKGVANIENIAANHRDQKVTLYLEDAPEDILYQSGAVSPGEYIHEIELNRALDPGHYKAIAHFDNYTTDTHEKTGEVNMTINLIVTD